MSEVVPAGGYERSRVHHRGNHLQADGPQAKYTERDKCKGQLLSRKYYKHIIRLSMSNSLTHHQVGVNTGDLKNRISQL